MWNDPQIVLSMLEAQFQLLLEAAGQRQAQLLPSILANAEREPLVNAALLDLAAEARLTFDAYLNHNAKLRKRLAEIWKTEGVQLTKALATETDRNQLNAYANIETFAQALKGRDVVQMPERPLRDDVPDSRTARLVKALLHWVHWAVQTHPGDKGVERWLRPVRSRLRSIEREERWAFRSLRLASETHGGFALHRLRTLVDQIHPHVDDVVRLAAFEELRRAVFADAEASGRGGEKRYIGWASEMILRDARVLYAEIRLRILRGLSRHGVLRRYAARCETFRAAELLAQSKGPSPERALTRNLAEYLFDQGFTPIIDPEIARLKPDIIDAAAGSLFYVEAKQYSTAAGARKLAQAYQQVWSTWFRLEKHYRLHEGFLVVFRRSGPLVELPTEPLDCGPRRLYSLLIDISPTAGSREREKPIRLLKDALLPASGG
jgi:hypothetical protein